MVEDGAESRLVREVATMTSSRWPDEEHLLAELGDAVRHAGPVPASVREAASAAFARRAVDVGRVLAILTYDSLLDDALHLRAERHAVPRILVFQADDLSVEIELADEEIIGQLVPPTMGEVAVTTFDAIATEATVGEATADPNGCFVLPRPQRGPVRLRCHTAASTMVTEWVSL
jgi:hypothetical protein